MRDAHNKMSKRHGDPSYEDLKAQGYLTKAILNYVALLGWSPRGDKAEQEVFSLQELAEVFDITGISKSPAIFDIEKLTYFNAHYLREMSPEAFHAAALPYIRQAVQNPALSTEEIAGLLDGQAVLTTATDARGIFAFDQWARRLGCAIPDPEKIRPVASRMLAGGTAAFWSQWPVAGECPSGVVPAGQEAAQVQLTIRDTPEPALKLVPRIVWAGIGCRRGVPAERLEAALRSGLEAAGLHPAALAGVCTIDRKGEEPGLLELCRRRRLPLLTYSPEELSRAEGEFTPSPFVRQVTGTDNVCERAAVLASGGPLLLKKTAGEGVTAALAAAPFAPGWEEAP